MTSTFEDIYEKLEQALCEDALDKSKVILDSIKEELVSVQASESSEEEFYKQYLLGLSWYYDPDESEIRSKKIIEYFKNALAIKGFDNYTLYYFGCHLFDEKKYASAREYFERIDFGYQENLEQSWRTLKVSELVLCCNLYLARDAKDILQYRTEAQSVLKAYNSREPDEVANPDEIINCLKIVNEVLATAGLAPIGIE
ncbi:hypothetical protein AAG747_28595 [Rapidithrix thailandica]|uniref:Tetratricopeptide repeat protein n=1 Tax=Rapidithrix thailandica TaxID=413964 RepID=A0AAW9S416_9BACT